MAKNLGDSRSAPVFKNHIFFYRYQHLHSYTLSYNNKLHVLYLVAHERYTSTPTLNKIITSLLQYVTGYLLFAILQINNQYHLYKDRLQVIDYKY